MKYTVYVIESAEGYRYTGTTKDFKLRLEQHINKGTSCRGDAIRPLAFLHFMLRDQPGVKVVTSIPSVIEDKHPPE